MKPSLHRNELGEVGAFSAQCEVVRYLGEERCRSVSLTLCLLPRVDGCRRNKVDTNDQFVRTPGATDAHRGTATEQAEALVHLAYMLPRNLARGATSPNFGAIGGTEHLSAIIGALLTYGLIIAVLMLVISATTWAIASNSGSWHTAQKAKVGCFVAIGGATLTGGALAWANWLLDVGAHL